MDPRVIPAMLAAMGGFLCGRSFAGASERRAKILIELSDALKMLRVYIVTMLEPVEDALRSTGFVLFHAVGEELRESESIAAAWEKVRTVQTKRGCAADCMHEKELSALDRMFSQLGERGREEQDTALLGCIEQVELLRDEAREKASINGRLYTSLGILAGLSLAVLLI